jgi:hypothetical protein
MSEAKVFIAGAGRAGTTFLMQLLTRLGQDTGFEPYREAYNPALRAGCEQLVYCNFWDDPPETIRATLAAAPRILKGPIWGLCLKHLLTQGYVAAEAVFVPFRDLDVSARSRLSVGLDWMVLAGLEGEEKERDQADRLAMVLGRTIEACMLFKVPCHMMYFPLLVENPDYTYERLSRVFELDRAAFDREFARLARPEQVQF